MVFLRPRHELTGAYDVPKSVTFRLSAIIQFPIIIPTTVAHIKHKFDSWRCLIKLHVEFEYASGPMIFVIVIPLNLKKNMGNSLSDHYHINRCTYFNSNLIYGYVITKYTGQVWIWSRSDDFWEFCLLNFIEN